MSEERLTPDHPGFYPDRCGRLEAHITGLLQLVATRDDWDRLDWVTIRHAQAALGGR